MYCNVILLNVLFLSAVQSAKILCIFPFPALSHQLVYRPIWRELLKDHQITVLSTHPTHEKHKNLEEIDIGYMDDRLKETNLMKLVAEKASIKKLFDAFLNSSNYVTEALFKTTLANFVQEDRNYDLIIGEPTYPAWYTLVDIFRCPIILISPLPLALTTHDSLGNPSHPVLYPDLNLPMPAVQQFKQRLISVAYSVYSRYLILRKHFPQQDLIAAKYLNTRTRSAIEIQDNVDLVFVQTIPGFHPARPTVPAYIQLCGLHIESARTLQKELQDFMDAATEGVVYISFGSLVTNSLLPNDTTDLILKTVAELPYKVLWKFDGPKPENKPENIRIETWFPQQDLLRHPNMKLFITHGGQQSISESLTFGVPMIGIPFFSDQFQNALRLDPVGVGLCLDKDNLSEAALQEAILEVIKNPRYRQRAQELADIAIDQPVKSLDKAIWWIEYVLRHKGAKHLRNPTVDIPFYQYFLVDVMLFLAVLTFVLWIVLKKIYFLIYKISVFCKNNFVCKSNKIKIH